MRPTPIYLLSLLLGASLLGTTPQTPITELKFTWVEADDPAAAAIRRTGEDWISRVGQQLAGEVNRVLASQGTEEAVGLLHLKKFPLPAASPGKPFVTAVKRTSLRVRDPANAPDNADLAALLSIQKELMDGNTPPKVLVQQVAATATHPFEWRVYRPISTMASCLVCHGPMDSVLPGVRARIERLYPTDQAHNYAAYEWRGVIRVSIMMPTVASGGK